MRYTFGDDNRIHAKPPSPSRGGHCTADLVERSSNELQPRREYPVSQRRGSVASMALDVLPPACLAGRGDSILARSEWATEQWIGRLGVLSPQVKLWVCMPGYDQRMFEDARKAECLAQEGRWAARWVIRELHRTPQQHANEIAKEATKDFFMRHPTSEMRCRRGYNAVSVEMAYISAQMAAELPDTASVLLFVAWWLAEEAGCYNRRVWSRLPLAAADAIEEIRQRCRRDGEERRVARARRQQEGKEAARR